MDKEGPDFWDWTMLIVITLYIGMMGYLIGSTIGGLMTISKMRHNNETHSLCVYEYER